MVFFNPVIEAADGVLVRSGRRGVVRTVPCVEVEKEAHGMWDALVSK